MATITTSTLLVAPMIPVITALLLMVAGSLNKPNLREACSITGAIITFVTVMSLFPHVLNGGSYDFNLATIYPGVSVKFHLDGLGLMFSGVASTLWIFASIYCIGYMRSLNEHAQTRFYVCYAVSVGAGIGAAFAGSVFTLYLMYEIISVMTYPLVMHHQDAEGYEGSKKYLIYLFFTSKVFLLPAMCILYVLTGSLDFNYTDVVNGIVPAGANSVMVMICYFGFFFGFAKAGVMPFHNWLPDAMVAPTPVSALLHAVVVVKVGVFSICRVMLSVFGVNLLESLGLGLFTAYFVSATILLGSCIALTKTNLKARLAYSTVSQLSYIILGVALLTPHGITGGLMHIANHAFSKITLFFAAGCIFCATGKKEISELGQLGYRMPVTMFAFAIASLSMIGVPPVAGFTTKWYLALASMDIHNVIILSVLIISSILNVGYFAPIVYTSFFGERPAGETAVGTLETQPLILLMVVPLAITGTISVLVGVYPNLLLNITKLMGGA